MRRRCSQGHNLPAAQLDSVARQMSRLTGLSVDYIKEANLRVSPTRFRKEVLRGDRKTLGRYDMRFEGEDVDAAGENPSYDASDTGISGAFVAAMHDYLERELKYECNGYVSAERGLTSGNGTGSTGRRSSAPGPGAASNRSPMWPAIWPRHPEESAPQGVFSERIFRPGDAILRDRVRSRPHGPGAGTTRERAVRILPVGAHDLSECGRAAPVERRSGGSSTIRRNRGGKVALLGAGQSIFCVDRGMQAGGFSSRKNHPLAATKIAVRQSCGALSCGAPWPGPPRPRICSCMASNFCFCWSFSTALILFWVSWRMRLHLRAAILLREPDWSCKSLHLLLAVDEQGLDLALLIGGEVRVRGSCVRAAGRGPSASGPRPA